MPLPVLPPDVELVAAQRFFGRRDGGAANAVEHQLAPHFVVGRQAFGALASFTASISTIAKEGSNW